jgi:hypothetical protein
MGNRQFRLGIHHDQNKSWGAVDAQYYMKASVLGLCDWRCPAKNLVFYQVLCWATNFSNDPRMMK